MGDPDGGEAAADRGQRFFGRRSEDDRECPGGEVPGARLARRVGNLGGGGACWEVGPHDDEVGEDALDRPGANASCSWRRD